MVRFISFLTLFFALMAAGCVSMSPMEEVEYKQVQNKIETHALQPVV